MPWHSTRLDHHLNQRALRQLLDHDAQVPKATFGTSSTSFTEKHPTQCQNHSGTRDHFGMVGEINSQLRISICQNRGKLKKSWARLKPRSRAGGRWRQPLNSRSRSCRRFITRVGKAHGAEKRASSRPRSVVPCTNTRRRPSQGLRARSYIRETPGKRRPSLLVRSSGAHPEDPPCATTMVRFARSMSSQRMIAKPRRPTSRAAAGWRAALVSGMADDDHLAGWRQPSRAQSNLLCSDDPAN